MKLVSVGQQDTFIRLREPALSLALLIYLIEILKRTTYNEFILYWKLNMSGLHSG